ncbi:ABC transporter permease [Paraburkholderia atlantica]|uniref:ABC transporter permease n=1 Tax=Paraburkholderia atlantica TaxID=2654982 RepID=UPI0001BF20A5|nr:ABC transporter permease subunit [Paraburkholderia atlantica]
MVEMLRSGELEQHLFASASRALAGFTIAVAIGVPFGLMIGWYRTLAEMLDPLLELFRNTAPLALLPVFVLVLGMDETSKVSVVVYSCVWPIMLNTVSGVRNVDPLLIRSALSMGLTPLQLFRKVVLPARAASGGNLHSWRDLSVRLTWIAGAMHRSSGHHRSIIQLATRDRQGQSVEAGP